VSADNKQFSRTIIFFRTKKM